MLLLLFYLGDQLYAIDSLRVVEVIPRVNVRKLYQAPDYVAGLFNYRGRVIPVIDLSLLIQGKPCSLCLSTRIIIVQYPGKPEQRDYLGLMAEQVTDTLNKSSVEEPESVRGNIIMDGHRIIELLCVESLFPEIEQLRVLYSY
ncbi:chemotaxis protein CheW [Gloeothece verrucosa]|uniref:CheW protein n=1 Tax=Gloeothece verrucosa (strain PCC 7822) TaxID=497965 RepID=E0UAE7_GLOV7|nr:chemotaxis protein CheW [Gloeothece verrucosa]ADN12688.1 CheW protein [Gloeothece verrucosa PCC 7822]